MQQKQLTEEELKNMSPEELQKYQKEQCIFCHIVSGKVQSKKVHEDEFCIAILDINPANPGHVLIMPKEHFAIMPQIPDDIIGHLFQVAKHMSQAILKSLGVEGTNIFVANGIAAGQKAQHFMLHVIPRTESDVIDFSVPKNPIADEDLKKVQSNIRQKVNKSFGIEDTEEEAKPPKEKKKKKALSKKTKEETPKEHDVKDEPKDDTTNILDTIDISQKKKDNPDSIDLDSITNLFEDSDD